MSKKTTVFIFTREPQISPVHLGFIKGMEFIQQLNKHWFLRKDTAQCVFLLIFTDISDIT